MDLCLESKAGTQEICGADEKRLTYPKLFWIFMLGSVMGFFLEGIWCVMLDGHWEDHRATVWGPFCVVYGFGALAIYIAAVLLKKQKPVVQFLGCAAAGSLVELVAGVFQNVCFGTSSWDYSHHALNLAGHISLQQSLIWGTLGIVFMRVMLPGLEGLLARMRGRGWMLACRVLSLYMAVNLLVSCAAFDRWEARHEGIEPRNRVESRIDELYHDARMQQLFPNWSFLSE